MFGNSCGKCIVYQIVNFAAHENIFEEKRHFWADIRSYADFF